MKVKSLQFHRCFLLAIFIALFVFSPTIEAASITGTLDTTVAIDDTTTNGPTLSDSDSYGVSVANIGDLNNDGVEDIAVGAYFDDGAGTDRGAVHISFLNTDGSIDSTVEINGSTTNGPTLSDSDRFGVSVANIGDLNNDGVNELAVGANFDDAGGADRGTVHILFMNTDGSLDSTVEINDNTTNGPTLTDGDRFGVSVAGLGDLDGDGVEDIAVGANLDDAGGTNRGAVHILYLNTDGSVDSTVEINDTTTNGPALVNGDAFGSSVANLGDLNDDGVVDLAVGAHLDDTAGTSRGTVHIEFMNTNGSVDSTVEINDNTANGPTLADSDQYGFSVAAPGDLNDDNVEDLLVGANLDDSGGTDRGAVYLSLLNTDGSIDSTIEINSTTTNGPTLADSDNFGHGVAAIGDLDGDEITEIAVGAPFNNTSGTDRGLMNIIYLHKQPGIVLTDTTVTVAENGGTDTVGVSLEEVPTTDVVLNVTSASTADATVSPATLTFTNSNWSTPQNITITGVNDSIVTNDSTTVTVSVNDASSDSLFDPASDRLITVTITNDDLSASGGIFWHILSNGQSLSIGARGTPAISTTQPYDNYSLSYDSGLTGSDEGPLGTAAPLIPLVENRQDPFNSTDTETISSGMANSLAAYDDPVSPDRKFIVSAHGRNSSEYSVIKKSGSSYPYANGQIQAANAKEEVEQTFSGEYRPLAVTLIHGERDADLGNGSGNPSAYEGYLEEFQQDYEDDLNALTGRSDTIPMFISQMNSRYPDQMAVAQYRESENNPNIYMVGPTYQYPFYSDHLHLVALSYRRLGEQFAKVIDKVLFESEEWKPLSPEIVARSGANVYVYYHVPVAPIVFDTTLVVQRTDGNYGYEFIETGGSGTDISSVSIIRDDVVKITLDSTPSGTTPRIKYAAQDLGAGDFGDPTNGAYSGGNVRDSDISTSPSSDSSDEPLYNWGVSFDENITNDTTAPTVTITAPTTSSSSSITNTTINITDNLILFADDVEVDPSTTAGVSGFSCTQTSTTEVDCSITITSSGNLVIAADDMVGNSGSDTQNSYSIVAEYTLTYTAGANGSISGTTPQTITAGNDGSAVTAVPNSGYQFVNWSDASTQNPRTDTNVAQNISVTANFSVTDTNTISSSGSYSINSNYWQKLKPNSNTTPFDMKRTCLSSSMLMFRFGSRGALVAELQKALNGLGFDSGLPDGIFGRLTDRAVRAFQKSNNLSIDGLVGPMTKAVLNKLCLM